MEKPPPPEQLDAMDEATFRATVRRFLSANYPPELRNPPKRLHLKDNRVWYMTLAEAGWLAPGWPREVGGLGLSPAKQIAMIEEFGPRIHFAHLRNVTREKDGSFYESEHLEGSTDMAEVILALMKEEARRREEGRSDWRIPMRPDHGHELLDDVGKGSFPGYPAVGRLRGLAELRGVMTALAQVKGYDA